MSGQYSVRSDKDLIGRIQGMVGALAPLIAQERRLAGDMVGRVSHAEVLARALAEACERRGFDLETLEGVAQEQETV